MLKLFSPLFIILIISQFPTVTDHLIWNKTYIFDGQFWRVITGNFTHTNWIHLFMNAGAFFLFVVMFKEYLSVKILWLLMMTLSMLIGLGLLFSSTESYVGLSAVLHGLFAWAALQDIKHQRHIGWALLLGIGIKVGWEHIFGAHHDTVSLIQAEVAINAHLVGAISGALLHFITLLREKR